MRRTVVWILVAGCAAFATARDRHALLVHPDEFTDRWIGRAAGLGLDVLGIHPVGGGGADKSLADLLARLETPAFRARIDAARARGLAVEYEMHAASWLLPRTLFEEHSEYFRMDADGRRTPKSNFCFSNAEAMKIACERAVELAHRLYGSSHRYYFWLDDVHDGGCRCPSCAKLSASEQQTLFLNAVLGALRREIPDAQLAYLAYQGTVSAPRQVKPAEGLFLEFAPINRDMTRPLREQDASELRDIRELLSLFGPDRARVLEYWFDNSYFSKWKKPAKRFVPKTEVIWSDRAYYRELGFGELCSFACYLGDDYEKLWGEPDVSSFARGFHSTAGGFDGTDFTWSLGDGRFRFSFDVVDATVHAVAWCSLLPPGPGPADFHRPCMLFKAELQR